MCPFFKFSELIDVFRVGGLFSHYRPRGILRRKEYILESWVFKICNAKTLSLPREKGLLVFTHYQKQTCEKPCEKARENQSIFTQFSYDLHNISHTFRLQISMHLKYQHVKSIWRVCENHVNNVWRMLSFSLVTCFFTCNFTYYFTHFFLVPKPFI